ncbi:MAG: hypothetical protein H6622_00540 [Halobacteriovoraceae bacterium]|nr:hypothetical protein [Halobacteriovoraceae bacterium]
MEVLKIEQLSKGTQYIELSPCIQDTKPEYYSKESIFIKDIDFQFIANPFHESNFSFNYYGNTFYSIDSIKNLINSFENINKNIDDSHNNKIVECLDRLLKESNLKKDYLFEKFDLPRKMDEFIVNLKNVVKEVIKYLKIQLENGNGIWVLGL